MLPVSIVTQYSAAQFAQSGLRGRREPTCTSARQHSAIDIRMSQALASVSELLPSPSYVEPFPLCLSVSLSYTSVSIVRVYKAAATASQA